MRPRRVPFHGQTEMRRAFEAAEVGDASRPLVQSILSSAKSGAGVYTASGWGRKPATYQNSKHKRRRKRR